MSSKRSPMRARNREGRGFQAQELGFGKKEEEFLHWVRWRGIREVYLAGRSCTGGGCGTTSFCFLCKVWAKGLNHTCKKNSVKALKRANNCLSCVEIGDK